MKVYKYQATGNDFILTKTKPSDPSGFAKAVCDRHFGIGADGILFPSSSAVSDIKMNYYNSDGTIAKMCGNGIRAFARFLYEEKIVNKIKFDIETLAGIKSVEVLNDGIKVNIGPANVHVGIPDLVHDIDAKTAYKFNDYSGYVLAVGTLHTVIYMNENSGIDILKAAPIIQGNNVFTDQTNVNFVEVINKTTLSVKTFERGSGWTLSCGTGVSASVYHAILKGYVIGSKIHVNVPGGQLEVDVYGESIYLIGPAKHIMEGEFHETN